MKEILMLLWEGPYWWAILFAMYAAWQFHCEIVVHRKMRHFLWQIRATRDGGVGNEHI